MWHAFLRLIAVVLLALASGVRASSAGASAVPQQVSPGFKDEPALVVRPTRAEHVAGDGEMTHVFRFQVANRSDHEVTIVAANTSCGCSVARMPSAPWVLAPGASGELEVEVDLAGKHGTLNKVATLDTVDGRKVLAMAITIPDSAARRLANAALAGADRQAVFKGDCAACHAAPTVGLRGAALFAAACGICHEAEPRATMVPALAPASGPRDPAYWRTLIAEGRPGTLMPGFAATTGGPLDDAQINSLVAYLLSL